MEKSENEYERLIGHVLLNYRHRLINSGVNVE